MIQESALEEDDELSSIFELVDAALVEALEAFSAFDNTRAEKLRSQMESLAQSARDLLEKFSDAVGKKPERSGFYVSLIIMARSLEQIIYLGFLHIPAKRFNPGFRVDSRMILYHF